MLLLCERVSEVHAEHSSKATEGAGQTEDWGLFSALEVTGAHGVVLLFSACRQSLRWVLRWRLQQAKKVLF